MLNDEISYLSSVSPANEFWNLFVNGLKTWNILAQQMQDNAEIMPNERGEQKSLSGTWAVQAMLQNNAN